jgi:putative oxidoreductase
VVVIGVIELVGGLLLIAGIWTRPVALVLAGDMVGAIVVSGIRHGETISLTLAPLELVAMCVLLWKGPGPRVLRSS